MDVHSFSFAFTIFKIDVFSPTFCIFDENFPTKRRLFDNFSTVQNLGSLSPARPPWLRRQR